MYPLIQFPCDARAHPQINTDAMTTAIATFQARRDRGIGRLLASLKTF